MIRLLIPESIHEESERIVKQMPVWKGSHRGLAANEVGVLGEVIIRECLRALDVPFVWDNQTSHDLSVDGKRVEIKTKDRTVRPLPHFGCSVPVYNHPHQNVDWYIFVSLLRGKGSEGPRRFSEAFILGVIGRKQLGELGKVWKAGETDEANGTKFWTDCINVSVDQLRPFMAASGYWAKQAGRVDT